MNNHRTELDGEHAANDPVHLNLKEHGYHAGGTLSRTMPHPSDKRRELQPKKPRGIK